MKKEITIKIVNGPKPCGCLICPKCGVHEINCEEKDIKKRKFNIRAFKVDDYSHCLKCGCWFDLDGNYE